MVFVYLLSYVKETSKAGNSAGRLVHPEPCILLENRVSPYFSIQWFSNLRVCKNSNRGASYPEEVLILWSRSASRPPWFQAGVEICSGFRGWRGVTARAPRSWAACLVATVASAQLLCFLKYLAGQTISMPQSHNLQLFLSCFWKALGLRSWRIIICWNNKRDLLIECLLYAKYCT